MDPCLVELVGDILARATKWPNVGKVFARERSTSARLRLSDLDMLADVVRSNWVASFKESMHSTLLQIVSEQAAHLETKTPRYHHIITRTKYNGKLPKRMADLFSLVASVSMFVAE